MEHTIDEVVSGLRQRIEELTEQVRSLNATVDELGARVRGLSRHSAEAPDAVRDRPGESLSISPGVRGFQASAFLSATAAVCFLLVIALILRMASDMGVINYQFGAFLGLAYAFALFAFAHIRYTRARRAIPVYSTCGGILVFAIVLENHAQFTAAFTPLSYLILAASAFVMILLGYLHSVPTLLGMGTLGVSVVAVAAGFPNPVFPLAATLILLANLAVCVRTHLPKCGWMAWGMLATTLFFWFTWTVKLATVLNRGDDPAPALASSWFLPILAAFVVWYVVLAARNALRTGQISHGFETALPILTVLWSYPVARSIAGSALIPRPVLGIAGLVLALGFVVFALALAKRQGSLTRETTAFIVAAVLLCGFTLPSLVWHISAATIVWSMLGVALAVLSWKWQSGALRAMSYSVQAVAGGVAVTAAGLMSLEPFSVWLVSVGLAMAGLCLGHYLWCRRRPPHDHGRFFSAIDPNDRTAIVPFLVAVICAFGAVRMVWYEIGSAIESGGAFQCGQSVILNAAAILLAMAGLVKKNGEFLVIAVVVAILGAVKVFAYDFFHIQNLPLVISVFSFGLTAAIGALIWKKCQGTES